MLQAQDDEAEVGKDEVGNEVVERDATNRWSRVRPGLLYAGLRAASPPLFGYDCPSISVKSCFACRLDSGLSGVLGVSDRAAGPGCCC